jgi:two-component system, OmpR family, alkaline phosphatase synthesis response regulator PhoP
MATARQTPPSPALTISTSRVPESGLRARPRILAIDDDSAVQRVLKRLFESELYDVALARDGTSGLELLRKMIPSVLVLDLLLPDIPGEELCQTIMQVAPALPIIVLSAKADVADMIMLLEMGAYDYVTKPFSPRELLARVRAVLTRSALNVKDDFIFDDVTISFSRMELMRGGKSVWLTAQEFKTLRFMIQNPERVISREELLRSVWGYKNFPSSTRTSQSRQTDGSDRKTSRGQTAVETHPGIPECWGDGERTGQPERGRHSTRRSTFSAVVQPRARRTRP